MVPKIVKVENFEISAEDSWFTLRFQIFLEIALSLTVFEIYAIFHFPQRNDHGGHLVFCKTFRIIRKKALSMINISYKFKSVHFMAIDILGQ